MRRPTKLFIEDQVDKVENNVLDLEAPKVDKDDLTNQTKQTIKDKVQMLQQRAWSTQTIVHPSTNKNAKGHAPEISEENNNQLQAHLVMGDAGSEKLLFYDIITNGTMRELSLISDEPESLAFDLANS